MSEMVLRVSPIDEYGPEEWIGRSTPLGDNAYFLFELDPDQSGTLDNGTEVMTLSATIGGGFTSKNLPLILRAIAAQLEVRTSA